MKAVFYESSAGALVSIDENMKLHLEQSPQKVNSDVPHIDKATAALRDYEVHVLDSIRSGTNERTAESGIYSSFLKPLFQDVLDIAHTYHSTDSRDSVRAFATGLAPGVKPTLVIVISGDTSINELVNSLSRVKNGLLKLFVVPAGTGNSLALSIGITDQVRAICRLATHKPDDSRPLNLYKAQFPEGSYIFDKEGSHLPVTAPILFLVVASWAFHASLVADSDTEDLRKYGLERFQMAAQQNLARPQKYVGKAVVWKHGKAVDEIDGPFAYFVLTPSQRFEPKFVISPEGNIFDSNLYLVSFGYQENDSYILDIMGQVYDNGQHTKNSSVRYECLADDTNLQLIIGKDNQAQNRRFCIDGAIVVTEEAVENEINFSHHGTSNNGWDIEIIS